MVFARLVSSALAPSKSNGLLATLLAWSNSIFSEVTELTTSPKVKLSSAFEDNSDFGAIGLSFFLLLEGVTSIAFSLRCSVIESGKYKLRSHQLSLRSFDILLLLALCLEMSFLTKFETKMLRSFWQISESRQDDKSNLPNRCSVTITRTFGASRATLEILTTSTSSLYEIEKLTIAWSDWLAAMMATKSCFNQNNYTKF